MPCSNNSKWAASLPCSSQDTGSPTLHRDHTLISNLELTANILEGQADQEDLAALDQDMADLTLDMGLQDQEARDQVMADPTLVMGLRDKEAMALLEFLGMVRLELLAMEVQANQVTQALEGLVLGPLSVGA